MKDELGNRIKKFYENITRIFLPRRTYTIIRIDGKAFHTYTSDLDSPFDYGFISDMNNTAKYLCEEIQGAKFAYVQSDEISILVTDFEKLGTCAWFDGNIQKISSVAASLATAEFNRLRVQRASRDLLIQSHGLSYDEWAPKEFAAFDCRVFTIPLKVEVENYFIWRQLDATRNSIQSAARAYCSHSECNNKNTNQLQELLFEKVGINWNNYDSGVKRGRIIIKETYQRAGVIRSRWVIKHPPILQKID